jgi:alkylation response protein AidB-like acyl-CoA dehydrogenase
VDFSVLTPDPESEAFRAEVRAHLDEHLTEEVHEHEWATGDGFHLGFYKSLGDKGWLFPTWSVEEGGAGLSPKLARILDEELQDRFAPMIPKGTTSLVVGAVKKWSPDDVKAEVLPGVASGDICMALGYTEPDTGSDLANVKTKAVRDGEEWVVNGQKMFTTGAHNCQYVFLLTRTNPDVPKHQGLTMFLVPLDAPGVEIGPVFTLTGERTNMLYLDEVRVADRYRLGPVDQGWRVANAPLNEEHGMDADGARPLEETTGENHMYIKVYLKAVADFIAHAQRPGPDGTRPADDPVLRARIGRWALDAELSKMTPGPMGRIVGVEMAQKDGADMIDALGPLGLLVHGEEAALNDGWFEYAHRYAQGIAIYGGTTDIHRNIIAEHYLGMPRSRPAKR